MKSLVWMIVGISVVTMVSGCGKKKAPEAQVEQVAEAVSTELPELEQNKMYLNNPIVSGEQDTKFEPVPDEQQHLSADEQALLGPALD